jgi:hypothetical protein
MMSEDDFDRYAAALDPDEARRQLAAAWRLLDRNLHLMERNLRSMEEQDRVNERLAALERQQDCPYCPHRNAIAPSMH